VIELECERHKGEKDLHVSQMNLPEVFPKVERKKTKGLPETSREEWKKKKASKKKRNKGPPKTRGPVPRCNE